MAETREDANKAFDLFLEKYKVKYSGAVDCLEKDRDVLLGFYDFPAEHWIHLRTTNPIESMFATVHLRHRRTKGNGTRAACRAMAFKLARGAEKNWRRLNSPLCFRRFSRVTTSWMESCKRRTPPDSQATTFDSFPCDRGQRYCSVECRQASRRRQVREAAQRYQRTFGGAENHRLRQRRYRDRRTVTRGCVTHQPRPDGARMVENPAFSSKIQRPSTPNPGHCLACGRGSNGWYSWFHLRSGRDPEVDASKWPGKRRKRLIIE